MAKWTQCVRHSLQQLKIAFACKLQVLIATGCQQEIGQRAYVSHGLESFAFIAKRNEQPERAARLLAAGEALREGLGTSLIAVMRLDDEYDATIAWLHERLDDATYEAIWSEGCGISMDQAVALALEE